MFTLRVGDKIKLNYGDKNINNCILHIRAIVDNDYIVFKKWNSNKQRWDYGVENIIFFEKREEYIV